MCKKLVVCEKCGQEVVRGVGARMHARECPGKVKIIPPRIQLRDSPQRDIPCLSDQG